MRFGKRSRSRKSRSRKSRSRKSRSRKSRSRKSRGRKSRGRKSRGRKSRGRKSRGRKSRGRKSKGSKRYREGDTLFLANGKKLKICKDSNGAEFVRSGKSKTKKDIGVTGKVIKAKKSRKFGRQPGLSSIMGNFSPSQMNALQAYTGMSAPQMAKHMKGVLPSDRQNFYTNIA